MLFYLRPNDLHVRDLEAKLGPDLPVCELKPWMFGKKFPEAGPAEVLLSDPNLLLKDLLGYY